MQIVLSEIDQIIDHQPAHSNIAFRIINIAKRQKQYNIKQNTSGRYLVVLYYQPAKFQRRAEAEEKQKELEELRRRVQKKKAQIFMFSCQAYSITTVKCFNIIQREFDRIVDSLNGEVFEKISQGNLTKLDQMIPTILKSRHTDSTGSIIRHSSIFMNQNIPNYNKIQCVQ